MDKDTAKQIVGRFLVSIHTLEEAVVIADAKCNEDEARGVRRAVGFALSEMYDRLLDPIYREHPDLVPPGVDYAPREGRTLAQMGKNSS